MKVGVSAEEMQGYNAAIVRGATEGFFSSLAFAAPASFLLHRRWAYYRALPLPLKFMGTVMVIAPCVSIQAERRGLEYDRLHWTGAGKMEMDRVTAEKEAEWKALSLGQKARDWAIRHQYSVIFGSWALSMAVSGAIVWRNKHQTASQKVIVQARLWAQGLTLGVFLAAALLTQSNREDAAANRKVSEFRLVILIC
ncbi:hypothetical protein F5I97DRAFT_1799759 [Phlebopus sp. FC_14]|nr:hypothetical protein F5I97DRAFT_1799759 [Phlebopus sp. FC_14]